MPLRPSKVQVLGLVAVGACQSAPLITSIRDAATKPASEEEPDAGSTAPIVPDA